MARTAGLSAGVVAVLIAAYAVYRAGAVTAPAPHRAAWRHHDVTAASGGDDAVYAPNVGSGTRALEEQADECPDDGSGPPECND